MAVECNVTPLGCCSNSILYPFSAIITPYTDFNFYGVLQQHSNFNSVVILVDIILIAPRKGSLLTLSVRIAAKFVSDVHTD